MKLTDVEYKKGYISLSKLTGLSIKDVTGYISTEFGEPTFKIFGVVLENDQELWAEGEHDFPYLVEGANPVNNFNYEVMQELYDETNTDDSYDEDNDSPY